MKGAVTADTTEKGLQESCCSGGAMGHACNPSYLRGEIRRIWQFNSRPGKKFTRPHLDHWLGKVMHACLPSCTSGRVMVQASLAINVSPYLKITKKAGGGGRETAQVSRGRTVKQLW
jgi:hypothetical protein